MIPQKLKKEIKFISQRSTKVIGKKAYSDR